MSERFHELVAWATRELPDEHAPFAASAALSLETLGREVTPAEVRRRLIDQCRDAKSNAERAERYP